MSSILSPQVMKSLDTAKDMLIRERQEKLGLREQLKGRDEELVSVQRKYLELQKAMSSLRETNNKYSEKVRVYPWLSVV